MPIKTDITSKQVTTCGLVLMNIYPNLRVDALQYVINKYKNIKMTYVPVSAYLGLSVWVWCALEKF